MASEIFLAVFHVCFDARYDVLNESGLRWWINENIRDFIVPTFICGNDRYRVPELRTYLLEIV